MKVTDEIEPQPHANHGQHVVAELGAYGVNVLALNKCYVDFRCIRNVDSI
ncbi:MAG TPA: hypothetical protein H9960_00690 [Candidatus Duodenibacillus intestinigallinarum]|nr:hypothetical protein [Candidatus Duodenibacillus intestinigallinarum]